MIHEFYTGYPPLILSYLCKVWYGDVPSISRSLILLIAGNTLTFLVGSKQAFEVSPTDVSQTQLQGKTDVYLELHVDVARLYLYFP